MSWRSSIIEQLWQEETEVKMKQIDEIIEQLRKEETEEYNREHGYLKDLDKCSYYDLIDRGIDPDEQIPSLYR